MYERRQRFVGALSDMAHKAATNEGPEGSKEYGSGLRISFAGRGV